MVVIVSNHLGGNEGRNEARIFTVCVSGFEQRAARILGRRGMAARGARRAWGSVLCVARFQLWP